MLNNISKEISETRIKYLRKSRDFIAARKGRNGDNIIFREIEADRVHTNFIRIVPASLLLFLVEVCGMLWALWAKIKFDYGVKFLISCIVFCVISVFFIFYINSGLKKSTSAKKRRFIYTLYWLFYTAEAMSFSLMELFDRGTVNNYITFIIVFTVLPILEPLPKTLVFFAAMAAQLWTMIYVDSSIGSIAVCAAVTAAGIFFSCVRFFFYISDKLTTKNLEFSANGDLLTGFMNRRGFLSRFVPLTEFCNNNGYDLCIIMIDIDNFKRFNDTYGHLKGDSCLRDVAACLKKDFSRPTDLCVRYGGEEFLIVTAQRDMGRLITHLQNVLFKISKLKIEDIDESVTVSVGVFSSKYDNSDIKERIEKADSQLYNAKNSGKNCVSYRDMIFTPQGK